MTEEQAAKITLEDVRVRFLETEQRLQDAIAAIDQVRNGAESIGTTREALVVASDRLATLAGSLSDLASTLGENASELRAGVEAIRMSDPAETRRQVEELSEAFAASQVVAAERLDATQAGILKAGEASQLAIAESVEGVRSDLTSTQAAIARTRLELRIGLIVVAVLAAIAVVVPFVAPAA